MEQIIFNVVTTVGLLVLAIAVHEWAHVAMARFLGDTTGEQMGRFTLNPLAHADPIWTILLPAYFVIAQTVAGSAFPVPFFGAGKPAPYTPIRLTRTFSGKRIRLRTAELLVAAAGPASNLVLAAVTMVVVIALIHAGQPLGGDPRSLSLLAFKFAVLNIGLFSFNLIPIPPLDGSKVVFNLLPAGLAQRYEAVVDRLSWVLMVLLIAGGAEFILAPVQGLFIDAMLAIVSLAT
jgi:Zn-dependent protease